MTPLKFMVLACLVVSFCGCASKKPKSDQDNGALSANISSDPLSLGPQGSDSGKIAGLSTIHFDFDRAVLEKGEYDVLKKDVQWIKSHPGVKIQIEGHCDARGSVEYNLALGDRRAKSVLNALVELGIPKNRLSTISFGEEKPIAQGDTEEAYAKNRRANFVPLNAETQTSPLAGAH